ncbi:hypothetical protein B0H13DRAFT_2656619 [Mycena leptocephala]|nr:hypothetical protein B0H13DRAFT_2656619 [Mycena leptocephala]
MSNLIKYRNIWRSWFLLPSDLQYYAMATPTTAPKEVQLLFGPMLIGVLLNTTLYGVLVVQMLMYYKRYKRDRKWFRYLALYLFIAETANVVFDIGLIYEPLITRYGTAKALEVSPLLLRPDAAVTVAVSTPIQLFVAWRVHVITKSYFFPLLIGLTSLISLAGGLSVTIMVTLHSNYADFSNFHPFVITWLAASAACDVILSAALIYSLYTRKSGVRSTDRYVDRIIRSTYPACTSIQKDTSTASYPFHGFFSYQHLRFHSNHSNYTSSLLCILSGLVAGPQTQSLEEMDHVLKNWGFRCLDNFLDTLFHPRTRGEKDHRSKTHRQLVSAFFEGHLDQVNGGHHSADLSPPRERRPKKRDVDQRSASFSPYRPLTDIRYAQPCLSAWATRLVGDHAYFRVGKIARTQRTEGKSRRHIRATTNGRTKDTDLVEWEDIEFTMDGPGKQYKEEDEFLWYVTECLTASRKNGKVVVKKTRPHSVIQVGAISSFITSRNRHDGGVGWETATEESADMPEIWTKLGAPDVDEMCLVDTAVYKIAAIDGEHSNFRPSFVA